MAVFNGKKMNELDHSFNLSVNALSAEMFETMSNRPAFPPLTTPNVAPKHDLLSAFLILLEKIKHSDFLPGLQRFETAYIPQCPQALNPALDFLHTYKNYWNNQHSYWRNREHTFEMAGLGQSIVLSLPFGQRQTALLDELFVKMHHICHQTSACFIGVTAFDEQQSPHKDDVWQSFESTKFILPALLLEKSSHQDHARSDKEGYQLCAHLYAAESDTFVHWQHKKSALIRALQRSITHLFTHKTPAVQSKAASNNALLNTHYSVNYKQWQQQVKRVKTLMNTNAQDAPIKKIVLSRAVTLTMATPIDALPVLNQWQALEKNCFSFALSHQNNHVFMGCSPERLFQRVQHRLTTESLAGTVARSGNIQHDAALVDYLLHNKKLIHEQEVVTQYIEDQLKPLSLPSSAQQSCQADKRSCKIFKLNRVQHRHLQLFSQLKPSTNPQASLDAKILQQLHPTPAVCGVPLKATKQLISDIEGRSRGWYAGAFGIVGDGYSEFCVSIRSLLTKDNTLQAYSGVGLVSQSQADKEWQELDDKLAALLSLL